MRLIPVSSLVYESMCEEVHHGTRSLESMQNFICVDEIPVDCDYEYLRYVVGEDAVKNLLVHRGIEVEKYFPKEPCSPIKSKPAKEQPKSSLSLKDKLIQTIQIWFN